MIAPVQQTPLPLDPARQQITPVPIPVSPGPPRPADDPIRPSATPKDKFKHEEGDKGGERRERAREQLQQAAAERKLGEAGYDDFEDSAPRLDIRV
jgi:hypothetical protein